MTGLMFWDSSRVEVTNITLDGAPGRIVFIADPHIRANNLEQTQEVVNTIYPSRKCGKGSMPRSTRCWGTTITMPG